MSIWLLATCFRLWECVDVLVGRQGGPGEFPWLFEKQLVIEHIFDYHESMELGDPTAGERTERTERSQPDVILDKLNNDLAAKPLIWLRSIASPT
jgi:hypothetical protein